MQHERCWREVIVLGKKKNYDENNFWIQCWLNTSVLYPPAHYVLQPLSVSEMSAKNNYYLNLTTIKCCVINPNGVRQEHKSSQLSKANKKRKVEFMSCLFVCLFETAEDINFNNS